MKMKIEEITRASEGDTIELESKVSLAKAPNSNDFDGEIVWGQFIVIKDDTGEQGAWLKLDSVDDKVTKGTAISIKGKLGKEYTTSRGKKARSLNNCEFEVVGKMQEPAQSSAKSSASSGNGTKDNYWEKKFDWEVKKDKRVQYLIVRQCAIKCATEFLAGSSANIRSLKVQEFYFEFADKIVDFIYKKKLTSEEETKEELIEEAREIVGDTEFKPASTEQKKYIFGYRNNKDEWCKGIIESRYMEKPEIRKIGAPEKLSFEDATGWLDWWWGKDKKSGERAKREKENPIEEIKESGGLVKGDKTSLAKDILVDEINAWRRENFLSDDKKFKEEFGYNPDLEKLSEEDLLKLKKLTKHFHPKSWDEVK